MTPLPIQKMVNNAKALPGTNGRKHADTGAFSALVLRDDKSALVSGNGKSEPVGKEGAIQADAVRVFRNGRPGALALPTATEPVAQSPRRGAANKVVDASADDKKETAPEVTGDFPTEVDTTPAAIAAGLLLPPVTLVRAAAQPATGARDPGTKEDEASTVASPDLAGLEKVVPAEKGPLQLPRKPATGGVTASNEKEPPANRSIESKAAEKSDPIVALSGSVQVERAASPENSAGDKPVSWSQPAGNFHANIATSIKSQATQDAAPAAATAPVIAVRLAENGGVKTLRIVLHPADFGQLSVKMSSVGDAMHITVKTETIAAHARLVAEQDDLRRSLELQGISVGTITVQAPGEPVPATSTQTSQSGSALMAGSGGRQEANGGFGRREQTRDAVAEQMEAARAETAKGGIYI